MKKNIRKEFVDEIRRALPDDMNAAIYLTSELGLGKETVYRRLRGTVSFSLDEAAQVARELGISLDRLVGITRPGNAGHEFDINYDQDFNDNYDLLVSGALGLFGKVAQDPSGIYIMAANYLPYFCYGNYKALSAFRYMRWLYERGQVRSFRADELTTVPHDYDKARVELMDAFRRIGGTYMIWDENVFRSLIKEIKYFKTLAMLTDEDVANMREELLDLLGRLEDMMIKGRTENGGRIYFYLSNVIFDTSYSYLESKGFQASLFHVYAVHYVESHSPEICSVQKTWLQTILRHSTLITQSGEIERTAYLKEQRELINTL